MTAEPVGFIGLGTMGQPMVAQLCSHDIPVVVFDVREEEAVPLLERGATWACSPADVAAACRVVFTSLPGPVQVNDVVTGPEGVMAGASPGSVHVDLSTSSFAAVREIASIEADGGVLHLDAPVSGARTRAADATLTIMVSGPDEGYRAARSALDAMGDPVFHLASEAGVGTLVKLANNVIALCGGLALQECFVMAAKAGIDPSTMLSVLETSTAKMYLAMAKPTLSRRFDEAFFRLDLAAKDLELAVRSGHALDVEMPIAEAAKALFDRAVDAGLGDQVFYATMKVLEDAAGVKVPALVWRK